VPETAKEIQAMAKRNADKGVIRLRVADPTATIPAGIFGNGNALIGGVKGRIHAMFAPREKKGILAIEVGDSVEGWMSANRNDAPNAENAKAIPLNVALDKMNDIKAHFSDVAPSNVVGRWEASIVLGGKFPSILLVRRMNYATIAISSESDGTWSAACARDKRWFSGAENTEKKGFAAMQTAIGEGMAMVEGVIATACVQQATQRRGAVDPAYAAKVAAKRAAKGQSVPASIGIAEAKALAKNKAALDALKVKLGGKIGAVVGTQRAIIGDHPAAGFVGKVIGGRTVQVNGKNVTYLTLTKGETVHEVLAKQTRKPKEKKPKAEGGSEAAAVVKAERKPKATKAETRAKALERARQKRIENIIAATGVSVEQATKILSMTEKRGRGPAKPKASAASTVVPVASPVIDQSAGF
jgi:hypothetical protein